MLFDREKLQLKPLAERRHNLDISMIKLLKHQNDLTIDDELKTVAADIIRAKSAKVAVIFMIGAHVIRSGVQNYLIDLMKNGYISCLAMNGAGMIHDYELSLIGATTESVSQYISEGQFGLWQETGSLNEIINNAYQEDPKIGLGGAVGKALYNGSYPDKSISLLAAGYSLNIPVTVHVGIGCDIIHEQPNCDGAATGALSYNDFLTFASVVQKLEGGAIMNFGSAVTAPEVYLKALSMARNIAKQADKQIRNFTTLVCDLQKLPPDFSREPERNDPAYYFRPWKTMLVRTVADGGRSYYICGRHVETIPALWQAIKEQEKNDQG